MEEINNNGNKSEQCNDWCLMNDWWTGKKHTHQLLHRITFFTLRCIIISGYNSESLSASGKKTSWILESLKKPHEINMVHALRCENDAIM